MSNFFLTKILSTQRQFRFCSHHSCAHAIEEITDYIIESVERKQHRHAIFLDFAKAFDTLDRKIPLDKLERYGFRGPVLEILINYMPDRVQYVSHRVKSTGTLLID